MTSDVMPAPPGWYADPQGSGQLRYWSGLQWTHHVVAPFAAAFAAPAPYVKPRRTYPLDVAVAELRVADPRSWGPWPFLIPTLFSIALIVLSSVFLGHQPAPASVTQHAVRIAEVVLGELAFGVSVWFGGWLIARRLGWARTLGWRGPKRRDFLYVPLGWLSALVLGVGIRLLLNAVSNGRASAEGANLRLQHYSLTTIIVLSFLAVVMAPVIEEVLFRGILLRSLMRRMTFWPACLITTLAFGLAHTYEVRTLLGAVTLALSVSTLSLVNCWLNRLTDRLTPGILVHATFNGFALLVLVLTH